MTRVVCVGHKGYGVAVRDHEAVVVRSTLSTVQTLARFSYAETGKAAAVGAAVLTAPDLDNTQEALDLAEIME